MSDGVEDAEERQGGGEETGEGVGAGGEGGKADMSIDGVDGAEEQSESRGEGAADAGDDLEKAVFGSSDSEAEDEEEEAQGTSSKEKGTGLPGAKVLLNKETGQLERGPSVEAPDRVFDSIGEGLGMEEPELEALPGKVYESSTLKVEVPVLQRPPADSKLYYVKQSQHIMIDPAQWEKDAKHDAAGLSDTAVRWKFGSDGERVSNTRIVKWSDGSMTMHLGAETLELNQSKLPENLHHLFVKQMATDGQPIIEAHGIMSSKLTFKADTKSQTSKKIYRNISSLGKRAIDKSEMVLKRTVDQDEQVKALSQQESMRIRGQARNEAHSRRMGGAGDMSADYLERDDFDGDLGSIRNNFKKGRYNSRMPDDSAVLQAKRGGGRKAVMDSDSSSSSSSDSDSPPPRRQVAGRKAVDSSSSSSSDSGVSGAASDSEEEEMRKSRPGKKPAARKALDDSDDSD